MDNTAFRKLTVLCWNVQGLGDPDKCGLVRDAVCAADPCIACLQETKLASVDAGKCRSFLPSRLSLHAVLDANGSRGGILSAWDPISYRLVSSLASEFSLTIVLESVASALIVSLTNVYAPSDHARSADLVADLSTVAATIIGPWLVLGDFNLIRFPHEKNNSNFNAPRAALFNGLINSLSWFELPLSNRLFTWTNKRSPQPWLVSIGPSSTTTGTLPSPTPL